MLLVACFLGWKCLRFVKAACRDGNPVWQLLALIGQRCPTLITESPFGVGCRLVYGVIAICDDKGLHKEVDPCNALGACCFPAIRAVADLILDRLRSEFVAYGTTFASACADGFVHIVSSIRTFKSRVEVRDP